MKDNSLQAIGPSRESVAACRKRLGPPPEDIWQQIVEEARAVLPERASTLSNPESDLWNAFALDNNGRLTLDPGALDVDVTLVQLPQIAEGTESDALDGQRLASEFATIEFASIELNSPESGSPESGSPESGSPESGSPESGGPESGGPESGGPESGGPESGGPESGGSEIASLIDNEIDDRIAPETNAQTSEIPEVDSIDGRGDRRKWWIGLAAAGAAAIVGGVVFWPASNSDSSNLETASSTLATRPLAGSGQPRGETTRDRSGDRFPSTEWNDGDEIAHSVDQPMMLSTDTDGATLVDPDASAGSILAGSDIMDASILSSGLSLDAFLPPEILAGSASEAASGAALDTGAASGARPEEPIDDEPVSSGEEVLGSSDSPGSELASDASLASSGDDEFPMGDDEAEDESDTVEEKNTAARDSGTAQTFSVAIPAAPVNNATPLPEPVDLMPLPGAAARGAGLTLALAFPDAAWKPWAAIEPTGVASQWRVVEVESSRPIAAIGIFDSPTGDGSDPVTEMGPGPDPDSDTIRFAWLDAARDVSQSKNLANARITTDRGDTVYLRPSLGGEAVRLDLGKRDLQLKWNLQSPIPLNLTRLAVDVIVPKDVEMRWMESIDPGSPRKTRGVAVLKLKTSDATAIVVRMDFRTHQTLSLRMRFGARLDPAMAWQWTDAATIRSSLNAVTGQLEAADRQLLALDAAITRAKRLRARRDEFLLEEQRDRIDEAVKGWTIVAKRLADLDQLVAFLDAGARVEAKLTVDWPGSDRPMPGSPDSPQVIFAAEDPN